MPDEEKRIIVDDDWKAEAQREKERLSEETAPPESLPAPSFAELINILAMQAMAGLGLLPGPDGQRIPPNLGIAKHFVDMLQVLDDKTKGNLTDEERKLLDQVLYEVRMSFVQMSSGADADAAPGYPPQATPGQ